MHMSALVTLAVFSCFVARLSDAVLVESERVAEYNARNHTWPPNPDDYVPNTDGWRRLSERRLRQVDAIDGNSNSYNGYVTSVYTALVSPNFTESGWGLTRAPQGLVGELVASLQNGLQQDLPDEYVLSSIEAPNRPKFITQNELNDRALRILHPIVEAWSGVKLKPNNAYGLRVYLNESTLGVHVDKIETHIISAILHVGHDDESEPWPIMIEDFQGNTNEVSLESGDILLYESSKCAHGRPRKFNGSWYSSLFLHYTPVDWDGQKIMLDTHYRIPPIWHATLPTDDEDLVVIETSFKEPSCENSWCALKDSVKLSGPAPGYAKVLSTGGITTIDLPSEEDIVKLERLASDEF